MFFFIIIINFLRSEKNNNKYIIYNTRIIYIHKPIVHDYICHEHIYIHIRVYIYIYNICNNEE